MTKAFEGRRQGGTFKEYLSGESQSIEMLIDLRSKLVTEYQHEQCLVRPKEAILFEEHKGKYGYCSSPEVS